MKKAVLLMLALLVPALMAPALMGQLAPSSAAVSPLPSVSAAQWREDIEFLARELPRLHQNAYHAISAQRFQEEIASLESDLTHLRREQIIARIVQIVASIGDGHTAVPVAALASQGFHVLPVRFYVYNDGIYVQAADRQYGEIVGGRLVSLGNAQEATLYDRVQTLVSRDNEQTIKDRLPAYLMVPELLYGLGIIDDINAVPVTVERDARQISVILRPIPMPQGPGMELPPLAPLTGDWADARDRSPALVALWLQHQDKNFWMEYLAAQKTPYVQYNRCFNMPDESVQHFGQRMLAEINDQPVEKVILDLRMNSGGEGFFNKGLLVPLIQSTKLDQRGKLVVLIGRRTFSAAQFLANDLEYYTNAVFAGEPTGSGPQFYGDHEHIVLPNSKLPVFVAPTRWVSHASQDRRPWIAPILSVRMTIEDYAQNRDPVLDAALGYVSLEQRLHAAWAEGTEAELQKIYQDFKQTPENRFLNLEAELNHTGYAYLQSAEVTRAISLFKLNASEHPDSPNAFDSLGDAYMGAGQKDLAVGAYQRAVQIDPHFAPSLASLKRINPEENRQ